MKTLKRIAVCVCVLATAAGLALVGAYYATVPGRFMERAGSGLRYFMSTPSGGSDVTGNRVFYDRARNALIVLPARRSHGGLFLGAQSDGFRISSGHGPEISVQQVRHTLFVVDSDSVIRSFRLGTGGAEAVARALSDRSVDDVRELLPKYTDPADGATLREALYAERPVADPSAGPSTASAPGVGG